MMSFYCIKTITTENILMSFNLKKNVYQKFTNKYKIHIGQSEWPKDLMKIQYFVTLITINKT